MKAAWKGHVAVVRLLLSERPSDGIDDLDSPGADVNKANRDAATALHFAADKGYTEIVEVLLSAGARESADKKGFFPVALAQAKGHSAIVEILQLRGPAAAASAVGQEQHGRIHGGAVASDAGSVSHV